MRKASGWISVSDGVILSAGLATLLLGRRAFTHMARQDMEILLAQSGAERETIVTDAMLHGLPDPVRRYLRYTGIAGKPVMHTVQLKQRGKIRGSAEQPWMNLDAEQIYTVRPPGFVWYGTMRLGPVPLVEARDRYADGSGNMLIRAGGIYPIADATGEEMALRLPRAA